MLIWQIVLLGVLYWLFNSTPLATTCAVDFAFVAGFICGIVMGDWKTGLMLGAAIQTLNMSPVTVGATMSYDLFSAVFIAVPLAMHAGLSAEVALTLAIPFAVICGNIYIPLERSLNSISAKLGEKAAEKGSIGGMFRAVNVWPPLYNFAARFIPIVVILYFGSDFVEILVNAIPDWLMNGLSVAGGMLPAVGFAMFLNIIGKRNLIVYFFLGFYVMYAFGLNTIVMSVFAVILAILHLTFTGELNGGISNE